MLLKTSLVIAASLFGFVLAGWETQDPQETQIDNSEFMQRKLDYTRTIVDGLATENYDKIAKGAQDLMLLSQEADWKVITTPEYLKLSSEFRTTAQRLREQGSSQNLDGSTLAYFEVTLNCIRCHKQLRNPSLLDEEE